MSEHDPDLLVTVGRMPEMGFVDPEGDIYPRPRPRRRWWRFWDRRPAVAPVSPWLRRLLVRAGEPLDRTPLRHRVDYSPPKKKGKSDAR